MKKIILILGIVLLVGCKSKTVVTAPKPEEVKIIKLMLPDVSESQKDKAYELGKRVLMTCNTSKFKPFNESEATASVIKNTTEERLTKTCTRFRQYYGTFKDLQLVEIYKNISDQTTIFRYKALYTKKVANKELRVSMNQENKVSSIKSLDWVDTFQNK
ncbi:hypothetical protein [Flavobacterium gawalongense]|uniref:Lipoprotein n=1 Tax=Flavobacterium gawalongense TaxID=2594432 RepID=A0ABY3CRZ8_9FLAO|nr:hypothetical protein [Flavobacterium gawalongense]TRX01532.1 hypothetical protein FNW33_09060 [Flavobacterium gawalongense]TRX06117.1 hypothetical protein FNW12_09225 [Flavobacterium gawalongense]